MKNWISLQIIALAILAVACQDGEKMVAVTTIDAKFETGTENWTSGFSEYSTEIDTASLAMRFYSSAMPAPIDTTTEGLRIQSQNRSDDMFMFVKRKISGFRPGAVYNVVFDIDLGTNYPENSFGAGGSPGGAVYIKVGATTEEPKDSVINDMHTFSLDKGVQSQPGKDMIVLGNVANGLERSTYQLVKRGNGDNPINATADKDGNIWLCVGSDSGYEGLTVLYYDRIVVKISENID